jgi:hypothetical protein
VVRAHAKVSSDRNFSEPFHNSLTLKARMEPKAGIEPESIRPYALESLLIVGDASRSKAFPRT